MIKKGKEKEHREAFMEIMRCQDEAIAAVRKYNKAVKNSEKFITPNTRVFLLNCRLYLAFNGPNGLVEIKI